MEFHLFERPVQYLNYYAKNSFDSFKLQKNDLKEIKLPAAKAYRSEAFGTF